MSSGRKISSDWKAGVGEPIFDLQVIQSMDKEEPASIVILSRQTITSILDTGSIREHAKTRLLCIGQNKNFYHIHYTDFIFAIIQN